MIIHFDADAFFASVEQAADSRLRNRPVAVGGLKRGIIASASYQARAMGVYTPMPTSRALRICPGLVVLPGDFEKYERFSRFLFSYWYDFSSEVEHSSIDEGYCDMGGNRRIRAETAAERIREAVGQTLKIPISEGVASNKLVSQIASKLHKPGGFVVVEAGRERAFLEPLDVKWLPGVGGKLEHVLKMAGFSHVGQVADASRESLALVTGNQSAGLQAFAQGIDHRPLVVDREDPLSHGRQETFDEDCSSEPELLRAVRCLTDRVTADLREGGKSARTVSVKVRYSDMDESERSDSLGEPADLAEEFYPVAERLFRKAWDRRVRLRMIRVKLSQLYRSPAFAGLFDGPWREKRGALHQAGEEIRRRYGAQALMRGHEWLRIKKEPGKPDLPG